MDHTDSGRFVTPSPDESSGSMSLECSQSEHYVYACQDDGSGERASILVCVTAAGVSFRADVAIPCNVKAIAISDSSRICRLSMVSVRVRVDAYAAPVVIIVSISFELSSVLCHVAAMAARIYCGAGSMYSVAVTLSCGMLVNSAIGNILLQSHIDALSSYLTCAIALSSVSVCLDASGSYIACVGYLGSVVCVGNACRATRVCSGVMHEIVLASASCVDVTPMVVRDVFTHIAFIAEAFAAACYMANHVGQVIGNSLMQSGANAIYGGFGGARIERHTRGEPTRICRAVALEQHIAICVIAKATHVLLSYASICASLVSTASGMRYRCDVVVAICVCGVNAASNAVFEVDLNISACFMLLAGLVKPVKMEPLEVCVAVAIHADGVIPVLEDRFGAGYTHLGRSMRQVMSEHGQIFGSGSDLFGYSVYALPYSAHVGSVVRLAADLGGRALLQASLTSYLLAVELLENEQARHVDEDLDWRPDIQYPKKPALPYVAEELDYDEEPEEQLPYLDTFTTSTLIELVSALEDINKAIAISKDMLTTVVLTIDPLDKPVVSEAIKCYCTINDNPDGIIYNDSDINYAIMSRCVVALDDPVADAVVAEWTMQMAASDVSAATAGEVAPLLLGIRTQLVDAIRFAGSYIAEQAAGQVVRVNNDGTIDPDHLEELRHSEQGQLDKISALFDDLDRALSGFDRDTYYLAQQRYANAVDKRYSLYDLSSSLRKQANEASKAADKSIMLMKAETYDILGDSLCCFAQRLLDRIPVTSTDAFCAAFDDTRQQLRRAKAMLVIWQQSNVLDYMKVRKPIDTQLILTSRLQAAFFADVRTKVMAPVVSWLDSLFDPIEQVFEQPVDGDLFGHTEQSSRYVDSCLPFEKIGTLMLDKIEGMLRQYNEIIADQLRATMASYTVANLALDSVEKRNEVRKTMRLFDDLVSLLDTVEKRYMHDIANFHQDIDHIIETFITTFAYDSSFDARTGVRRKVGTLCG